MILIPFTPKSGDAATISDGKAALETDKPWISDTLQVTVPSGAASNHIIPGRDCSHAVDLVWAGRVAVAHSLQDVASMTANNVGITVALTRGQQAAQDEVTAFAVANKVLSVKRSTNQCISCACKVAFVSGALLVIG